MLPVSFSSTFLLSPATQKISIAPTRYATGQNDCLDVDTVYLLQRSFPIRSLRVFGTTYRRHVSLCGSDTAQILQTFSRIEKTILASGTKNKNHKALYSTGGQETVA